MAKRIVVKTWDEVAADIDRMAEKLVCGSMTVAEADGYSRLIRERTRNFTEQRKRVELALKYAELTGQTKSLKGCLQLPEVK